MIGISHSGLNRNKIRLLVGERQAELYFLAYSDDDGATEASLVIADLAHKTSNQSMKPTAPFQSNLSVLPRHPAVAYLFLVSRAMSMNRRRQQSTPMHGSRT